MKPGDRVKFTGPQLVGDLCDIRITDPQVGEQGTIVPDDYERGVGIFTVVFDTYGEAEFLPNELEMINR